MTARTKRLVAILAIVGASLRTLPALVARELTFASAFAYFAIMFGTLNAFDWFVIDCGLIYWKPRFVVLPGLRDRLPCGLGPRGDRRFLRRAQNVPRLDRASLVDVRWAIEPRRKELAG